MLGMLGQVRQVHAQENEFGFWMGASLYVGDLNPAFSLKNVRWASGTFFRYNLSNRMAVRAGINYGFLDAADSRIKNFPFLQHRNLSFKSQLLELALTYEINFFKFSTIDPKHRWSPYIYTGFSLFYFDPYVKLDGDKYKLESIGTEGQKSSNNPTRNRGYNQYSFAIPYGGGIKYAINANWGINVELSSRFVFTDFLDDVSGDYPDVIDVAYPVDAVNIGEILYDRSPEVGPKIGVAGKQRGTSQDKDRFLFLGVTLTYTIMNIKCPKPL
jgi:Domain of unknown function (DUF6089)